MRFTSAVESAFDAVFMFDVAPLIVTLTTCVVDAGATLAGAGAGAATGAGAEPYNDVPAPVPFPDTLGFPPPMVGLETT